MLAHIGPIINASFCILFKKTVADVAPDTMLCFTLFYVCKLSALNTTVVAIPEFKVKRSAFDQVIENYLSRINFWYNLPCMCKMCLCSNSVALFLGRIQVILSIMCS